ncbi:MAG: HIT domain-containing protein [Acidobacteriota bacterium]
MDHLWSPWRYRYVSTHKADAPEACIFCAKPAAQDDDTHFIVLRAQYNFVLLNLYPYTNGHLMIAPYEHVASLSDAHPDTMAEMMRLTVRCEKALMQLYHPHGINLGMNLGEAAGAGIAGHIHMHMLPRWRGDASFMSTISETRVLPEDLPTTYKRLQSALASPPQQ